MGEKINKDFEDFQKNLEEREKRLKGKVSFEPSDDIDKAVEELKTKEVVL